MQKKPPNSQYSQYFKSVLNILGVAVPIEPQNKRNKVEYELL